jgi:hypothetical protein
LGGRKKKPFLSIPKKCEAAHYYLFKKIEIEREAQ